MVDYIEWRKVQAKVRTGYGAYNYYWTRDISDKTDPVMLEHFSALKKNSKLKNRIEASTFSIYSNDEAELKAFNDKIDPKYHSTLKSISCPKDSATQKLLEAGHILSKNIKDYKYKVTFCDGKYDANAKKQLLAYLEGLGDVVSISKGTRRSLDNGHNYTWGNYIHVNDTSVLSFVDLIIPGIVGKTHEITKI